MGLVVEEFDYLMEADIRKCIWARDKGEGCHMLQELKGQVNSGDIIVLEEGASSWGSLLMGLPVCKPWDIHESQGSIIYGQHVQKDFAQNPNAMSFEKFKQKERKTMQQENEGNWLLEERRRKKYQVHTMLRFEVQLAEHCNLNCRGCSHYAPIAEPEFLDLDEYERDLARLSELFDHECRWIHLMGGEPLLHPEIIRAMKLTRQYFPYGEILVVTNGLLLGKMTEEFWQVCQGCNIVISATKYPVNCDYEKHRQKAESEGVRFEFYNGGQSIKTLGRFPLSPAGNGQPSDAFVRCGTSNVCLALRHGRIYGCDAATYAHHVIKKYNLPIHESKRDSIDIYKAKSAEEIMEHCAKPIPFCRYCKLGSVTEGEPFRQSCHDRYEWVEFEGNQADWEYLRQFSKVYVCTDGQLGHDCAWKAHLQGIEAQVIQNSSAADNLPDYGDDTAFLLCFKDKMKRRETEKLLWEKKAVHMIPMSWPAYGGQA